MISSSETSLGVVIVLAGWQRIDARSPWLTLFSHETPQKQSQAAPTPSLQSSELEENSVYRSLSSSWPSLAASRLQQWRVLPSHHHAQPDPAQSCWCFAGASSPSCESLYDLQGVFLFNLKSRNNNLLLKTRWHPFLERRVI